jgi:hypothetical protein
MPRRKADIARILRANRIGCFLIAAVFAAFVAALVYIAVSSPFENAQNAVIPTPQ